MTDDTEQPGFNLVPVVVVAAVLIVLTVAACLGGAAVWMANQPSP